jgi:hypothetical protein
MHGYEPGTVTPTSRLVLAHRHPDEHQLRQLVEQITADFL